MGDASPSSHVCRAPLPLLSGPVTAAPFLQFCDQTWTGQALGQEGRPSGRGRVGQPDTHQVYALVNLHSVSLRSDFNLGNIPVNNNI